MKKFLLQILLFFLCLFSIDRIVGYSLAYMIKNSKGGYIGHHNYIIDGVNEDVLIFGSSRASHHYNPQVFVDSLGLSCYNCGQDGNGIILSYGWWEIIKEHYYPQILIYDIEPKYDLLESDNNQKFLGWLKESYDRGITKKIFSDVDRNECYKMNSMMYRYNSKFHQIIADYIYPIYVIRENGYVPLKGEFDSLRFKDRESVDGKPQFDSLKIRYLNNLINDVDSVQIVFVVSPSWYGMPPAILSPIREICIKRNIPFIDFSNDPKYVRNNNYFKDGLHLNARGADEFSKDLIRELKMSKPSTFLNQ